MLFGFGKKSITASNGYADTASHEDYLGISNYYKALANYIKTCETPMSISVEGDWGTGKTTAIEHVIDILQDSGCVDCVRLDMWSYAGLEHGGSVTAALLQDLCNELAQKGVLKRSNADKLRATAKNYGAAALSIALGFAGNSDTLGSLDRLMSASPLRDIKEFKADLTQSIRERASQKGGTDYRLVIVVDDLDRLNPRMAIEILEALKNFVDCEGCVFLIAIDFLVVSQGAKLKYGELFDDERARRFFDKIFQLRFQLPVNEFNIAEYLKAQFMEDSDQETVERFAHAACTLMADGYGNPRNIKRAFNLFSLHKLLSMQEVGSEPLDDFFLFASLLIQIYDVGAYRKLASHSANVKTLVDYIRSFKDIEDDEDDLAEYIGKIDETLGLGIFEGAVNTQNINSFARCLLSGAKLLESERTPAKPKRSERLGRFTFSEVGIKVGEELTFAEDESITAQVYSDTQIMFNGNVTSLSKSAKELKKLNRPLRGTLYWCYKGERLTDLRNRLSRE